MTLVAAVDGFVGSHLNLQDKMWLTLQNIATNALLGFSLIGVMRVQRLALTSSLAIVGQTSLAGGATAAFFLLLLQQILAIWCWPRCPSREETEH